MHQHYLNLRALTFELMRSEDVEPSHEPSDALVKTG